MGGSTSSYSRLLGKEQKGQVSHHQVTLPFFNKGRKGHQVLIRVAGDCCTGEHLISAMIQAKKKGQCSTNMLSCCQLGHSKQAHSPAPIKGIQTDVSKVPASEYSAECTWNGKPGNPMPVPNWTLAPPGHRRNNSLSRLPFA